MHPLQNTGGQTQGPQIHFHLSFHSPYGQYTPHTRMSVADLQQINAGTDPSGSSLGLHLSDSGVESKELVFLRTGNHRGIKTLSASRRFRLVRPGRVSRAICHLRSVNATRPGGRASSSFDSALGRQ